LDLDVRILFVDDEPGIRTTLPLILQQHGFEVEVTATVAEALKRINESSLISNV
jgi:DNA-binding response OmpR family regulator